MDNDTTLFTQHIFDMQSHLEKDIMGPGFASGDAYFKILYELNDVSLIVSVYDL